MNLLYLAVNFFFPEKCALCKEWLNLIENPPLCRKCSGRLEFMPHKNTLKNIVLYSILTYRDDAAELIQQMKYGKYIKVGRFLGRKLGEYLLEEKIAPRFHLLVPIPLHPSREQERGFNQSLVIAQELKKILHIPVEYRQLKRIRNTPTQTDLTPSERTENISEAFKAGDRFAGRNILLVDDVATTGATLTEARKALRNAGA
ncbi:MAG TPA: ComF family protein, partial [bacterium]|nr:ComF family protein [bacterium]